MESIQDIVVYSSIALAAFYLFRKMILPRFRKSSGGCDKCAAHQAVSARPGVKVKKLTPEESALLRQEIENL